MVTMMVVVVVQVSDVYRKIRLTIRFLLGNVHDFDPSQHAVPYSQLPLTDRYLLARFAHLLQDAQTTYRQFQFAKVYQVVSKVYQVVCTSLPGSLHRTLAWLFSLMLCAGLFCERDAVLSQYLFSQVYQFPEVYQSALARGLQTGRLLETSPRRSTKLSAQNSGITCEPDDAQSRQPASLFDVPVDCPLANSYACFVCALCYKKNRKFYTCYRSLYDPFHLLRHAIFCYNIQPAFHSG